MLSEHRRRRSQELGREPNGRELLACREDESPIHRQSFSQAFTRVIEHVGLRKIRLHDLRHTHATIAVKVGVPVRVISERLGHESPAFTLKQYTHVVPGMHAQASELVAAAIDVTPP